MRQHFQRSADVFKRYGRVGFREEESPAATTRNRDQNVADAFARSAETFRQREGRASSKTTRASRAPTDTTSYGEYASAADCPRDPSLADAFARSAEEFERFGRAGSRHTTTPSGSYEATTEGCHTREIDDLFSRSAEKYVQSGGKRKADSDYFRKTNARTNAAKTEYPYDGKAARPDDFFSNGRSTSKTASRSSRQPYEAPAQPKAGEKKRNSSVRSGGAYAYAFGSASAKVAEEVRRSPPPPPAAPQGPTTSQSYASILREKERALEAKIAALRQSEAEAQARYEAYLAQEMGNDPNGAFDPAVSMEDFAAAAVANEQVIDDAAEAEQGGVATTTIRSESGSNINFGMNVIGGRRKNNNNDAAYLTP